jgi:hypothetical protein
MTANPLKKVMSVGTQGLCLYNPIVMTVSISNPKSNPAYNAISETLRTSENKISNNANIAIAKWNACSIFTNFLIFSIESVIVKKDTKWGHAHSSRASDRQA